MIKLNHKMLNKLLRMTSVLAIPVAMLGGFTASAQNRAIHGTVVDATGAPVVGAAVVVVGNTAIGAVIGVDGSYRLNVPAGASLEFSCIGYASQVIPVGNQSVINVVLQEDTEFLDETVVIGYGVQRKSDLTGSVASVKSADLMDRSTADAAAARARPPASRCSTTPALRARAPPSASAASPPTAAPASARSSSWTA